jgi:hypothetical protein
VIDVNLRMTYFSLHQKERKLAEMVEALKVRLPLALLGLRMWLTLSR